MLGVAAAIVFFVVAEGDSTGHLEQLRVMFAEDFGPHQDVLLHHRPLVGIQGAGFEQDGIRCSDLADVMHRRGVEQLIGMGDAEAGGEGENA